MIAQFAKRKSLLKMEGSTVIDAFPNNSFALEIIKLNTRLQRNSRYYHQTYFQIKLIRLV